MRKFKCFSFVGLMNGNWGKSKKGNQIQTKPITSFFSLLNNNRIRFNICHFLFSSQNCFCFVSSELQLICIYCDRNFYAPRADSVEPFIFIFYFKLIDVVGVVFNFQFKNIYYICIDIYWKSFSYSWKTKKKKNYDKMLCDK